MLALIFTEMFFQILDSIICHFPWNAKTLSKEKKCFSCKFFGGLSLSNFQFYYWAVNIAKVIFWSKTIDMPWLQLKAL